MADHLALRGDGEDMKAVSTAHSINFTPMGPNKVPVPYPVIADLSNSVKCVPNVRFNSKPAYVLDQTTQTGCKGDEAGSDKGVKSGTVNGIVEPTKGSPSVRVNGKNLLREGDPCKMQGGNTVGAFMTIPARPKVQGGGEEPASTDPPVEAANEEEEAFFESRGQSSNSEEMDPVQDSVTLRSEPAKKGCDFPGKSQPRFAPQKGVASQGQAQNIQGSQSSASLGAGAVPTMQSPVVGEVKGFGERVRSLLGKKGAAREGYSEREFSRQAMRGLLKRAYEDYYKAQDDLSRRLVDSTFGRPKSSDNMAQGYGAEFYDIFGPYIKFLSIMKKPVALINQVNSAKAFEYVKSNGKLRKIAKKIKDKILEKVNRKKGKIVKSESSEPADVPKKVDGGQIPKSQSGTNKNELGDLFKRKRKVKASELEEYAQKQGWRREQTSTGPVKYFDENGVERLTIKSGSSRTPGSENPHVAIRNEHGKRIDPFGNEVTKKSAGNHTEIEYDIGVQ